MASDGGSAAASLLDVAIRAAVAAGAPRRTVAATAAAVAHVALVELRGGAGAKGGAAAPSASQKRRTKRKKKAAKERLATSPTQPPSGGDADHSVGSGEAQVSAPVVSAPSVPTLNAEQPLPLRPIPEDTPPNTCAVCSQTFCTRNALHRHLRESGHSKQFAPSSAGDDMSISGSSAASIGPSNASASAVQESPPREGKGLQESGLAGPPPLPAHDASSAIARQGGKRKGLWG